MGGSALLAAHETMLERLRAELRRAVDAVLQPKPTGAALVDFPMHSNVGDLAIWAGEHAVLSDLEVQLPTRATEDVPIVVELRRRS